MLEPGCGETPHGEADPTIVNPRRLDRPQRLDVCFQCHLGDAKQTERVSRHDRKQRMDGYCQQFAARLEAHCLRAPFQWFNFYDFWSEEGSDAGH